MDSGRTQEPKGCFVFVCRTVRTCPESWRRQAVGEELNENWREGEPSLSLSLSFFSSWREKVRKKKKKDERPHGGLKVVEEGTLYERN